MGLFMNILILSIGIAILALFVILLSWAFSWHGTVLYFVLTILIVIWLSSAAILAFREERCNRIETKYKALKNQSKSSPGGGTLAAPAAPVAPVAPAAPPTPMASSAPPTPMTRRGSTSSSPTPEKPPTGSSSAGLGTTTFPRGTVKPSNTVSSAFEIKISPGGETPITNYKDLFLTIKDNNLNTSVNPNDQYINKFFDELNNDEETVNRITRELGLREETKENRFDKFNRNIGLTGLDSVIAMAMYMFSFINGYNTLLYNASNNKIYRIYYSGRDGVDPVWSGEVSDFGIGLPFLYDLNPENIKFYLAGDGRSISFANMTASKINK